MTLRRYTVLEPGHGTQWPREVRDAARLRDRGCVGPRIGMPGACDGPLDLDHVRSSQALGRKSRSTLDNAVTLCRFIHHRLKTDEGRKWRPPLLEYLSNAERDLSSPTSQAADEADREDAPPRRGPTRW